MAKIAVAGKGGSGKTTVAGVLARLWAEDGLEVLTVDADENPNLGISLGMGVERTYQLVGAREALLLEGPAIASSMEHIVDEFAAEAGENVRIVQVRKFDHFRPGWGGLSAGQLLAALDEKPGRVVLVDLGGGVMTVARGDESQIDALVVVVEPYPRSAEVGRRMLDMAAEKGMSRTYLVANKITGPEDLEAVRQFVGREPDIVVPDDRAVRLADRVGASPIDHDRESPAVGALRGFATALLV